jgi:hypothetical protein
MSAQLQIDQDGLAPGEPGRSRTDGLATGALATLTNTGTGATTNFRLLWAPPGDTTAVPSLGATDDPKVWTFAPTSDKWGSYLVELIEDAGLVTERRERRSLGVRTPSGLLIPALNERGDSRASFVTPGSGELADNNATDYTDPDLNALPYAAWWRTMHELFMHVNALGSGSGSGSGNPVVSLRYAFSTVTTDGDPGAETVRVNAGGDALLVNPGDASGADWSAFFDDLARGFVRMETLGGASWIVFAITGVETAAGYYRLFVATVQSNGDPFGDGAALRLTFDAARTGRGAIPSITGETTTAALASVIAALVALGLATDDR